MVSVLPQVGPVTTPFILSVQDPVMMSIHPFCCPVPRGGVRASCVPSMTPAGRPLRQKLMGLQQAEFRVTLHCVWTSGGQLEVLSPRPGALPATADQETNMASEDDSDISDLEPDAA